MVGETTIDSFLGLLGQSDLVSDAQLLALTAEFLGENLRPESPQKLADELVKREVLTTWQAEMLMQGRHRGFRLGPYRILRPLGQGGMSKVFLAEHEMMRRRSAIKVLPSKYQEDKDLLTRFHLEARAVAALDHPNIVRAYDFNKDVRYGKEIHYLVMEYVEGSDLRRMVDDQGPLDYRKAADFICQAALGLSHAHVAGFVHRDIKPANLLVDPHGVLKILDLGLATFTFEAENTLNPDEGAQSAVGTADYVAPEQVIDSRNVDGRADIYSLGLTFYFLLTGHRPFSKPTIMEVLMAHRTEKPAPIGTFRPDVPMDLEAIIEKMTAKSPKHRYQTAKEVSEALQKWQSDSGSARTYSRLSTLMAEAARMKQSTANDTTPATSSATANTELELKLVEDESGIPKDADEEKTSTDDSSKIEKPIMAESLEKNHKSAAGSGALPRAKSLEERPKEIKSVKKCEVPGKTTTMMDTDLLAGLFAEDLSSASPSGMPLSNLAGVESPLPSVAFTAARKSMQEKTVRQSPWIWIGLTSAVVLALIALIFITVFVFSSTQPPNSASVKENITSPAEESPPSPPAPLETGQPSPSVDSQTPPLSPQTTEPPPVAPMPPPSIEQKQPVVQPEPSKKEEVAEQPATAPPVPKKPEEPPEPQPTAVEPEEPPEPQPPAVNPEELLAGIKNICVLLVETFDKTPRSSVNQAIVSRAKVAVRRVRVKDLKIDITNKSKNVMEVKLTSSEKTDQVILTAELKCPGPNGDPVVVWSKSEPIYTHDPKKGDLKDPDVSHAAYRELQNEAPDLADAFYKQFTEDVEKAHAKFLKKK